MAPTTFTVDRKFWVNARNSSDWNPSRLLNFNGMRCCLGFYCEEAGIPQEDLQDRISPNWLCEPETKNGLVVLRSDLPQKLYPQGSLQKAQHLFARAMQVNDNRSLSDSDREQALIVLFAKYDIELTFVGSYA